jgi:DHA1 family tetracycline resistance protein-like MFS transporter
MAPTLTWLFVGRCIAGITGASFTTATAYIADVSPPEKKAQNFGLIGAAFGLGFILGPVMGGLLGKFGPTVPFFAAAGLTLLNWLYGFFILPESLEKHLRRPFEWKRANPLGSLKMLKNYPKVLGLIVALSFLFVASHAVQSNWSYFTIKRFGWSEDMVGYSLGLAGLLVGLVQAGLTRIVVPKLGEKKSVFLGFSLYIVGFLLFSFASQSWMMFAFLIPYCMGGFAGPALQSIMSNNVPPNEQGELQGANTSIMSLTSIIGPPLMTNLFAYFTAPQAPIYFPGAAFFMAALLTIVGTIWAYKELKKH